MEFAYDGGGMGKGGNVPLYCDGKEVGKGRVDRTQGVIFSADETTDIGRETGTTVSPDYTAHTSRFNGTIDWVRIDLGDDAADADHYIDADDASASRWRGLARPVDDAEHLVHRHGQPRIRRSRLLRRRSAARRADPEHRQARAGGHQAAQLQRRTAVHTEPVVCDDRPAFDQVGTHSVPIAGGPYGLVQWEETIAKVCRNMVMPLGISASGIWAMCRVGCPLTRVSTSGTASPTPPMSRCGPPQPRFDPTLAHDAHIYEGERGTPSREVKVYDLTTRPEIDMEITDRAVGFMERSAAAGKPFYAYVPYTLVHYPTLPSAEFSGRTGKGDWADCLAQIDHNVGRLVDTIERLGQRENTIVVFTSDNGADTSTLHKRGSAGPWAGTMFTPMEGSNRVPFIIRWPGRVPADRETDAIVHEVDTFTTLLRFVGADVPLDRPIDGVDQRDLLLGESESSAREGFPILR